MGLTAENVSYVYEADTGFAVPALHDVNVRVEHGRILLVIGPSGSGKSTLLGLLGGLLEPTSGRVEVDGHAVRLSKDPRHARVGLVFQNPESQLFAETVAADVSFGPRNLGVKPADARRVGDRALRDVGLDPAVFGPRSPFSLSGGEARRAAIAGVLAMRPAYLLLDEPTAGLDASGRKLVVDLLRRLRESTGLVVVTHDPEEMLGIADDVVAIVDGGVGFRGTVRELLKDPGPLEGSGMRLPEALRAQVLAARRAGMAPVLDLDADAAARRLLEWRATR